MERVDILRDALHVNMVILYFIFQCQNIEGMEAAAYCLQVFQELQWLHSGVERDGLTQFVEPCVVHDHKNKVASFIFGSSKELVIRNFFLFEPVRPWIDPR